jgi:hypothetical protein
VHCQDYGADAVEVYMTFCTLLAALAYVSRRTLSAGHPGCEWLTGDERQLLNLIAAAQAEDADLFDANLRWLARAELHTSLAMTANAFAHALTANPAGNAGGARDRPREAVASRDRAALGRVITQGALRELGHGRAAG